MWNSHWKISRHAKKPCLILSESGFVGNIYVGRRSRRLSLRARWMAGGEYMELKERIWQLLGEGLHCSQVMMQLSLDYRGMDEPFTIRALGALGGGMFARRTCGTLTGGVAMLSSYFKREEGEPEPTEYQELARELTEYFEQENGSIECRDLVEFDREKIMQFCPGLIERTFIKCIEILEAHGIDPAT